MQPGSKRALLTIFLVVFLDLLGFGLVIPILPYYAQEYGASGWSLGWLMTSYSLMQFFFSPLWGSLSDRAGRRPVLLLSIAGSVGSLLILGFANSLVWLFVGRILAGIFGANISTAYAYVNDITTPENRAKGMGMVGASFGLGFIFGPALGGVLSHWGYDVPMFVGAGLSFVNLIFGWFYLQEPPLTAEQRAAHRHRRFDWETNRQVFSNPQTRVAILLFFLLTFAVTQMEVVFGIFLKAEYDYDAEHAGMLLALMGLIMVGVQGGLIGKLAKRFGESQLIFWGLLICSISLLAFALSDSLLGIVISLSILAFAHGLSHPSLSSLASQGASPDRRGTVMGVFQSAGSMARVLGPPCAGLFYDQISRRAPFLLGVAVLVVGALFSFHLLKRPRILKTS